MLRAVDRTVRALLALLLGGATANVLWQVTSRYLLGDPSPWTDELSRYLLVWLGVLGAAHAFATRSHLAVGLLSPESRWGRRLAPVEDGAVLLFALAVPLFGGARLVLLSAELGQRSAALGIPLAAIYAVLPLAGLLIALHAGVSLMSRRGNAA